MEIFVNKVIYDHMFHLIIMQYLMIVKIEIAICPTVNQPIFGMLYCIWIFNTRYITTQWFILAKRMKLEQHTKMYGLGLLIQ